jgi:hypothetical protein
MNLPPDVHCLNDAKLFLWRPRGILNEEKVDHIIGFITDQEKKYGKTFDRFTDLSAIDAVDLTFKYVFQVALYRRLARVGQAPIRSAFFVTSPAVARYVKLHALVTDHSPLQVAMFEDRSAAAEWLGVSPALLACKDE